MSAKKRAYVRTAPVSAETRAKLSAANKGRVFSDASKDKMSIARGTPVLINGVRYRSATAAGQCLGLSRPTVMYRVHATTPKFAAWQLLPKETVTTP